jgi:hypothetical protein
MILPRMFAITLVAVALGAAAQEPAQPQQAAKVSEQKPNSDDKVSCRVTKEGNSLKRTCMTRSQWRKLESRSDDIDESGLRNPRCPLGAC